MTEIPSPFSTTHPRASNESNAAAERLVVPKMPGLPKLGSLAERINAAIPQGEAAADAVTPRAPTVEPPIEQTPAPPSSEATLAARVEYPAARSGESK